MSLGGRRQGQSRQQQAQTASSSHFSCWCPGHRMSLPGDFRRPAQWIGCGRTWVSSLMNQQGSPAHPWRMNNAVPQCKLSLKVPLSRIYPSRLSPGTVARCVTTAQELHVISEILAPSAIWEFVSQLENLAKDGFSWDWLLSFMSVNEQIPFSAFLLFE